MRILVLNYEYPPLGGGAAPVCEQLCRRFAAAGNSVEALTMAFGDLPRRELRDGVSIVRVPALRSRQDLCHIHEMLSYVLSAYPRALTRMAGNKYDIVHVHFVIPSGLIAFLAAPFAKIPCVITAHGSDIPGYNPDRFVRAHHFTPPLLRAIMRRAGAVASPSRYLRKLIRESCGPLDIAYIPNGIDLELFAPGRKTRRIFMSGRLLRRKGFQYALEALRGVETDYEVHIAGDGPMRAELETLAKTLDTKVVFHGWLDHDSPVLKELYAVSSIFCLPSEQENASVSLLEAMSAGLAVITSDRSGCPETAGGACIAVPPRDTEAIRRALVELMASETSIAEWGRKARRRVCEHFNWDGISRQYLDLFERIARK